MFEQKFEIKGRKGQIVSIPKRRSVAKHYKFFDPPNKVWDNINQKVWPYVTRIALLRQRDLAFMSLLYLTVARVSELCKFIFFREGMEKPKIMKSIRKSQFVQIGSFLEVRNVRIVKRKFVGKKLVEVPSDYPLRNVIRLPMKGGLNVFTNAIVEYLKTIENPDGELFKFRRQRGFQIVQHCTGGQFPHYLRCMGLKMWLRVFNKNIFMLQKFSGHADIKNLFPYLEEVLTKEVEDKSLKLELKDFEV